MPTVGKILGQAWPLEDVLTDLYTVPTGGSTTVSSIVVCNTGTDPQEFYVSTAEDGAPDELKQYLWKQTPIDGRDTFVATMGVILGADDVIRVKSSGSIAFQAYGLEST
jgi:hypothetical protein